MIEWARCKNLCSLIPFDCFDAYMAVADTAASLCELLWQQ